MRLFIAIQFNDEIIEALNELQEDLRDQGMEGHYSRSENLHLTLAFIGEYGDPEEVMDALEYTTLSILLQAHIYIFFLAIKYHLFDIEDIGYDSSIHTSLIFNEPWESLMQIQD